MSACFSLACFKILILCIREGSEEEVSSGLSDSLASGEYLSMKQSLLKNRDVETRPSPGPQQPQKEATSNDQTTLQAKDLTTLVNNLAEFQKAQYGLHCSVEALKVGRLTNSFEAEIIK